MRITPRENETGVTPEAHYFSASSTSARRTRAEYPDLIRFTVHGFSGAPLFTHFNAPRHRSSILYILHITDPPNNGSSTLSILQIMDPPHYRSSILWILHIIDPLYYGSCRLSILYTTDPTDYRSSMSPILHIIDTPCY